MGSSATLQPLRGGSGHDRAGTSLCRPMRILTVHNRYRHLGGEDLSSAHEDTVLRDHGWVVDSVHGHQRPPGGGLIAGGGREHHLERAEPARRRREDPRVQAGPPENPQHDAPDFTVGVLRGADDGRAGRAGAPQLPPRLRRRNAGAERRGLRGLPEHADPHPGAAPRVLPPESRRDRRRRHDARRAPWPRHMAAADSAVHRAHQLRERQVHRGRFPRREDSRQAKLRVGPRRRSGTGRVRAVRRPPVA